MIKISVQVDMGREIPEIVLTETAYQVILAAVDMLDRTDWFDKSSRRRGIVADLLNISPDKLADEIEDLLAILPDPENK